MKKIILYLFLFYCTTTFSSERVNILVGFPPGGGQYLLGQIIDKGLQDKGINSILISKSGAGGIIALNECIEKSDPNTLCLVSQSQLVYFDNLPNGAVKYDPKDLVYIKLIGQSPLVLLTNNKNTKSKDDIISDIKNNNVSFGSGALGITFTVERLFKHFNSMYAYNVPYRGVGPAIVDLIGGHINYVIAPYAACKNDIIQGKVRLVETLDNKQSLQSFFAPPTLFGFVSSNKLSKLEIKKLENVILSLMENQTFIKNLQEQGIFIADKSLSGEDFKNIISQERSLSKTFR
jgi:tripartite-type tricarboxylate transporter receptor subunit TctC